MERRNRTIPGLVEDQAANRPEAVAVRTRNEFITYGELNNRATALASQLIRQGVGSEVVVGLCMKSSISLIVGALGVLKAGGAFLPLDPVFPAQRLSYVLNDANVRMVLIAPGTAASVPQGPWTPIELPRNSFPMPAPKALPEIDSKDLAYVIYTSGSTGHPKGVEVTHSNLMNLVAWHQQEFSISSSDRATQVAGVAFDAAMWEVWPYLTAGASVHIPDDSIRTEPEALRDWLVAEGITITFQPTAIAERLIKLDWPEAVALRTLLTGADTLYHFPSAALPFALVNNYGPTECTVVTTSGIVPATGEGRPAIGRPIAGSRVYVLDDQLNPVPDGTPGELHISGQGVARGYRNRPDLTAEKFIPDPFANNPGAHMYKTGDIGCYQPDGQLVFLGRIDDQVKVRGYRIEPNEIVTAVTRHAAVCESVVVARDYGSEEKRLVAYVVLNQDFPITTVELQEFLRMSLPEYMVPPTFVRLDRLPLNANGKVDRAALPEPGVGNTLAGGLYQSPRSPVEEHMVVLLMDLLEVDTIGMNDNFFHLGGHSLLGAQVIARVQDTFGVELSLRTLFDHPTVEGLSAEIEELIMMKIMAGEQEHISMAA